MGLQQVLIATQENEWFEWRLAIRGSYSVQLVRESWTNAERETGWACVLKSLQVMLFDSLLRI